MKTYLASAIALAAFASAGAASAQAIIDNGTIQLGVDSLGQLNIFNNAYPSAGGTTPVGLRDLRTGYESTSPGCLCEGWGVADSISGVSGYANNAVGTAGLTFVSFNLGGTGTHPNSIGSAVTTKSTAGSLSITHSYAPSTSFNLYRDLVTITNNGTVDANVLYRRTMDWDIEPTAFSEYSTIQGVGGNVTANDNGFCSSDPLSFCGPLSASGNFIDNGPSDHGANFDFNFGLLGAGKTLQFITFYGAALTEAEALLALSTVGANVYSFGQNSRDINGGNGSTFIFAFRGVNGTSVPEASTWAMLIAGFGLVGAAARRRRTVVTA